MSSSYFQCSNVQLQEIFKPFFNASEILMKASNAFHNKILKVLQSERKKASIHSVFLQIILMGFLGLSDKNSARKVSLKFSMRKFKAQLFGSPLLWKIHFSCYFFQIPLLASATCSATEI